MSVTRIHIGKRYAPNTSLYQPNFDGCYFLECHTQVSAQLTHLYFKDISKTLYNVFMERLYNVKMAFFYVIKTFPQTFSEHVTITL